MNVAATLECIDRAAAPLRDLADRAPSLPPAIREQVAPYFRQAAAALGQLEAETARAVLAMAGRPLPAPDPAAPGSWPSAIKRSQTAGPILHMPLPDEYVRVAQNLEARFRQLGTAVDEALRATQNAGGPTPIGGRPVGQEPMTAPVSAPFAAPPGFAPIEAAPEPAPAPRSSAPAEKSGHRVFGLMLLGLSTLGTAGVAYAAHKAEKKGQLGGYTPDELDSAAREAQTWLDREAPGRQISLTRGPTGEVTATVIKGRQRVARERGSDPRVVAQAALDAAAREDDIALPLVGAEVLEPSAKDEKQEAKAG